MNKDEGVIQNIMKNPTGNRTVKSSHKSAYATSFAKEEGRGYSSTRVSSMDGENRVIKSRATTAAKNRQRTTNQRRQDLAFNSHHEEREQKMKENNTLLLRQRLVRNMLSVKNSRIDSAKKVFKTNLIAH